MFRDQHGNSGWRFQGSSHIMSQVFLLLSPVYEAGQDHHHDMYIQSYKPFSSSYKLSYYFV